MFKRLIKVEKKGKLYHHETSLAMLLNFHSTLLLDLSKFE